MVNDDFHHGLEIRDDSPKYLRLGCLRLMDVMSALHLQQITSDVMREGLPLWTKRWRSVHFQQNTTKFRELFWRFDRVSEHLGRCEHSIRRWQIDRADSQDGSRLDDPDLMAYRDAVQDLPIFIDSQLVYLRSQIDVFTTFVSYLYERPPSAHSFRELRKWFISKRPAADPEFSKLLATQTVWFDLLSGDSPRGLREVVVHYRGTHQLGWKQGPDGTSFQLMPMIANDGGIATENALDDVRKITLGWFSFLDSAFVHFRAKLLETGVKPALFADAEFSVVLNCSGHWRESYWVYPIKVIP